MKRNRMMIALTGFVVFIVVLLSLWLHTSSRKEVISLFREHQLSSARHLSNKMESFLWGSSQVLQSLLSSAPSPFERMRETKANIRAFSKRMDEAYIKVVSLYDATGSIIYSTNYDVIGSNQDGSEFFVKAKEKENKGRLFVSHGSIGTRERLLLLGTPFYRGIPGKEKFAGVLSFGVDLEEWITAQLDFVNPQVALPHVWIMGRNGDLLFQSEHPEMEMNNLYQRDKSCIQCHMSFDYVERIIREKEGTVDYHVENLTKLAAFASVQSEDASWIVVVNSPYDHVVAFAKKGLWEYFFLLGIMVLVFVGGSAFILSRGRLKGKRRWELKLQNRDTSLDLASARSAAPLVNPDRHKLGD